MLGDVCRHQRVKQALHHASARGMVRRRTIVAGTTQSVTREKRVRNTWDGSRTRKPSPEAILLGSSTLREVPDLWVGRGDDFNCSSLTLTKSELRIHLPAHLLLHLTERGFDPRFLLVVSLFLQPW